MVNYTIRYHYTTETSDSNALSDKQTALFDNFLIVCYADYMNTTVKGLPIKNLRYATSVHSKGHIYANWTRQTNVLIFVKKGMMKIESDHGSVTAVSGECVFIPKGASGSTYFLHERNSTFSFYYDFCENTGEKSVVLYEKNSESDRWIDDVWRAYSNKVVNINFYYSSYYHLIYQLSENKKVEKKYKKIHELMLYLERNYDLNLKISDYAKAALMSESGLRSRFKEYTGKSIVEYRNDVRLKRAEEFILSGMTVSEAALKVGFSSLPYYCRVAKKKSDR